MKVGVYVAAGPNPIFMRMLMLQLERQTKLPEFISIFENGFKTPAFQWVCKDIIQRLEQKNVKVLHNHDPEKSWEVNWYFQALKMLLYNSETEVFLKMDTDDFYTETYVENMCGLLGEHDLSINNNSGILLVRPFNGDFKYKESVVMKNSPIGAAPTHVAFNRKFAEKYLGYLSHHSKNEQTADDDLMAECSLGMKVNVVDGPVDYTYVSHGSNHSSSAWQYTGGKIYFDK